MPSCRGWVQNQDAARHSKVLMVLSSIRYARRGAAAAGVAALVTLWPAAALSQQVQFRHVFDNSPLDVTPKPNEQFTEAVREFHRTGQNPYGGKPEVIEEGKRLYGQFCQACHLPDGSGGMGASLIGDKHIYPRITTDIGWFEVVFGGASGAMQPFGLRMTQDQILRVMAYVRTLTKK
jgi:cytochrome c-L